MWTGTTSIRDYISTPIRMCTFVCTLTYKHVFFLARTAKSVSQEWAQGTCKGSRVRNRHIHTHIFHPSSKTVLTGLFNRTKPQSLSIYNPPSFFLSPIFFHSLFYLFTPTFKHWFSSRQFFYGACACVCVHAQARVCLQTCLIDVRACCEAVSLSPCRTDVPAWLCGFTSAARLLKIKIKIGWKMVAICKPGSDIFGFKAASQ